jgi:hypothetical protein
MVSDGPGAGLEDHLISLALVKVSKPEGVAARGRLLPQQKAQLRRVRILI